MPLTSSSHDSSAMSERSPPLEVNVGTKVRVVTYTGDGEYLVSGDKESVRVWRLKDGKQMANMEARDVLCLAVSKDGRWIAAGTRWDRLFVWDAKTYEKIIENKEENNVHAIDFSPDSSRLVVALRNRAAFVWDLATRQRVVGPLYHGKGFIAAKYSPNGNRIATATQKSVRMWDGLDGRLLVDVPVSVTPLYNSGLLWAQEHLFVVSDNKIKVLDTSAGSLSTISEWFVPDTTNLSCIALPEHGEMIACSSNRTVTFWDASTYTKLKLIEHVHDIHSFALSPDDQSLALAGEDGKITVINLSHVTISVPLSRPHPTFLESDIQIDPTALYLWKYNQLEDAEELLSAAITTAQNTSHHLLASRSLVRARLRIWDAAIVDAENSIKTKPSVIGYISKSMALVGKGEKYKGYRACDIAFEHFHSTHISYLLLIKAIIVFMAGDHDDAILRVSDLISMHHFDTLCHVVQTNMYLLLGSLRMENNDYKGAIQSFERAQARLRSYTGPRLVDISLITGWNFDDLGIKIRRHLCEALYAAGRIKEAGDLILEIIKTTEEEFHMNMPIAEWVSDFAQRCLSIPESELSNMAQQDETAIDSASPSPLLQHWAKVTLAGRSWKDALVAVNFTVPRFLIYRVVCEHLETIDRIIDASECFRQLLDESAGQIMPEEHAEWILDFKHRCSVKFIALGDNALRTKQYNDAIYRYSAALSLQPDSPEELFIKRSKAYMANGSWENALHDANKVIQLDPLSPWGYERKHAALHKARDYDNAIDAFEMALSKMSESPDLEVRKHRSNYVTPAQTKIAIRRAIQDAIRDSPRVLINTICGHLCAKAEQSAAFESLPVYKELISSMTTHIDDARIEHEVQKYYRYAMFSHKWEENEPLFKHLIHIVVYDLGESLTHNKLQMFCKVARDAGFYWAWSDTCCIDKSDHIVLQEAHIAMFKWYEGSAMTIVFLRGVRSLSQRGALVRSIWNTRAWTLQEYHASKVVRFYTEDWTPYLNLNIHNHKDSPEVIAEMEEATGLSAQALMALRPGLTHTREKLCLASRRETTLVEDAAYSLLGIFNVTLPIFYGEGDKALGRLLAQLLTNSGDGSILAWSGKSGSFNSCLPANITVFSHFPAAHIPPFIRAADMASTGLQTFPSPLNLASVMKLYEEVSKLSVPFFVGQRLKLPCLTFALGPVAPRWSIGSEHVFNAKGSGLGVVEIRTSEDLSELDSLILVHPWIDFLLGQDRDHVGDISEMIFKDLTHRPSSPSDAPRANKRSPTLARVQARLWQQSGPRVRVVGSGDMSSELPVILPSPASTTSLDKETRALLFMARLKQSFGALLFTPTRQGAMEYRRVAADSMIRVQIQEDMPLEKLITRARVVDVI